MAATQKLDAVRRDPLPSLPDRAFEVVVLHTGLEGTLAALRAAGQLAHGLGARIRLLVPQVVPYPLSLNRPQVIPAFTRRRFRTLAAGAAIETRVDLRICRDAWEMLRSTLQAHSVVVLGGKRRWWPTAETRAAARLRRLGHHVLFVGITKG